MNINYAKTGFLSGSKVLIGHTINLRKRLNNLKHELKKKKVPIENFRFCALNSNQKFSHAKMMYLKTFYIYLMKALSVQVSNKLQAKL